MQEIDTLFKNRSFDFSKLEAFGFVKDGVKYRYTSVLGDTGFEVGIVVTKSGKLSADVFDCETGEPYVLVKFRRRPALLSAKSGRLWRKFWKRLRNPVVIPRFLKAVRPRRSLAILNRNMAMSWNFYGRNSPEMPLCAVRTMINGMRLFCRFRRIKSVYRETR